MDTEKYLDRIERLRKRTKPGSYENLTGKQKALYHCVKDLFARSKKPVLRRKYIKKQCLPEGVYEPRNTVISDFCYNLVNKEDNDNKFLLNAGPGLYRFVDFDWLIDEEIEVTWTLRGLTGKTVTVGSYLNRRFSWDFEKLLKELDELATIKSDT
jgi:hypothetical protein